MIQIPDQLAQAIHDYLMGRPMREVEQLVVALRQCASPPASNVNGEDKKGGA